MNTTTYDWKDVADSYFDKAVTLALVLALFGTLVIPKVQTAKQQQMTSQQMQMVDLPKEERDKLKPPDPIVKLKNIVISEELGGTGNDAKNLELAKEAIKQLDVDFNKVNPGNKPATAADEKPFEFVPYEEAPVPISTVQPEYPPFAVKSGLSGTVFLEVDVYKDGTLGNITVMKSLLKGPQGFDEAAINAVKKWKFQPGKSGGKPVDTRVIIPIEFNLTRN